MKHLVVLALTVENLASMGAIVVSVNAWRLLRARFLVYFVAFQILVFVAGLAEHARSYSVANLGLDSLASELSFTIAIALPTVVGLWCLIRSVESIVARRLSWIRVPFLGAASLGLAATLALEAGNDHTVGPAATALVFPVVVFLCLIGLAAQLMSAPPGWHGQKVKALRWAGTWIGIKVVADLAVMIAHTLGGLGSSTALILQAMFETAAAAAVMSLVHRFARFVAGERRSDAGPIEVKQELLVAFGISPREAEVVALVMSGLANKEIADRLHISPVTVKDHLYRIYRKSGVKNRVQLANLFRP